MKINKQELLRVLEIVKPGLATKEVIQQSTSFCFLNGNIVTYNDEISISCPVENLDITGAINAAEFYAFIGKIKTDEIDCEVNGNEMSLKAGRAKAGFNLEAEIQLPVDEIGSIDNWKTLPEDFSKAINFAKGACSRDMSKPVLTCVHVNKKTVTSSDNHRIVEYQLSNKIQVKPFLLPANSCGTVTRLKPTQIADGKAWIHFKTKEGAVISCRVFEDSFPDVTQHLNVEGADITFPKELLSIIDRAEVFSKRDHLLDESISILVDTKKLIVKSESSSAHFEEKARVNYSGEKITFQITPYLLKDILSQTTVGILGANKLLFEGENWKYMTLLRD